MSNRQWRLARHPEPEEIIGFEHFELTQERIPEPQRDEFVLKTLALGTSPAQRSYISKSLSMHEKIAVGDIMRGRGVGVVTASRHSDYTEVEIVVASTGWHEYSVQHPEKENPNVLSVRKVANPVKPLTTALGTLGSAGVTAYFGLLDAGQAKAGDAVVVSAAAGGIGSVVGQIARIKGCCVIGIAGGSEKCKWLINDLNFDDTIDY